MITLVPDNQTDSANANTAVPRLARADTDASANGGLGESKHLGRPLSAVKAQGDMFEGQKNGVWEWYYENGEMRFKGAFINGIKDGEWEEYFIEGELSKKTRYNKGTLINIICFDKSGNEIQCE